MFPARGTTLGKRITDWGHKNTAEKNIRIIKKINK